MVQTWTENDIRSELINSISWKVSNIIRQKLYANKKVIKAKPYKDLSISFWWNFLPHDKWATFDLT